MASSPADAGRVYQVGFSAAATPAIPLPDDPRSLPLAPDALFEETKGASTDLVAGHLGTFDAQGRASVQLSLATLPRFRGRTIHFAVVVKDPAVPLGICRIQSGQFRLR